MVLKNLFQNKFVSFHKHLEITMSEKPTKEIKLEHFKNLVAVAYADGYLDEDEEDFLYDKADDIGLPYDKVEEIIKQADQLQFMVPLNMQDREDQLADIVYMSMIDGELHDKEYELCLSIAHKLGFQQKDLDEAIELTKKLWEQ